MASYKLVLKPSLRKDLRSLPPAMVLRVLQQFDALSADPLPKSSVKLTGAERRYRIRIGDYRIIYEVDHNTQQVVVHYVRHRREAYRNR